MKKVTIVDEGIRGFITSSQKFFGESVPDLEGEFVAINPSAEHYGSLNPNFKMAVMVKRYKPEDIIKGVVYYDAGAGRHFLLREEDVKIEEVN